FVTATNAAGTGAPSTSVSMTPGSPSVPASRPPRDLNGDGRGDILIRDSGNGLVYGWLMNGVAIAGGGYVLSADSGWSPVRIADLNGDGKADILLQHTDGSLYAWIMDGL